MKERARDAFDVPLVIARMLAIIDRDGMKRRRRRFQMDRHTVRRKKFNRRSA